MKKPQIIALAVSVVCALAVMVIGIVMFFSQPEENSPGNSEESSVATTQLGGESCEKQDETLPESTEPAEEVKQPPADLPPKVEILPEEEPEEGETEVGVKFPCTVPGYDLVLEVIAPYDGMFVEDGSNRQSQQVAMILVKNNGDYPIEYAQLAVQYGDNQLVFAISALPAGERLVVQEQTAQKIPQGPVTKVTALVVQQAEMVMSEKEIRVTDLGDDRLKVENLTDQNFSSVRIFYKYYMKEEAVFVGGIAFAVKIYRLDAKDTVTIQPAHYSSTTGRVVMVRTYQ